MLNTTVTSFFEAQISNPCCVALCCTRDLQEAFEAMDEDKSGAIDMKEFTKLIKPRAQLLTHFLLNYSRGDINKCALLGKTCY